MPLVQAEVVTDEAGRQLVFGLANVRGKWVVARYEIARLSKNGQARRGRAATHPTKRPRSEAVPGAL
jgi:hypothetical protein